MKLNIYYSQLNSISADEMIKTLKDRNRDQKHIIITPDKSSLYYERKLFSLLDEDSFFDVSTTTLSRFANSVAGVNKNILSKQGGVLIIKRLLMENKDSLLSFSKSCNLLGFAGTLFDTICMFKSCNVLPSDIEDVKGITLNNKLKDIKLIYQKYEEYLSSEYTDSFNRLSLCASAITKEKFKDVNFYFVGFQDFTKQGYLIIDKLIKCSSSVNVATTFAKKDETKNNSNIYLNTMFYNLIDMAKLSGVGYNLIETKNELDSERLFLLNNVCANKTGKYNDESNYVKLNRYDSVDDEIKNVVIDIKHNIINKKLRYKNFAIIVSDLSTYKKKIKEQLDKLKLEYFVDESVKLNETLVARFISNIISILYNPTKYNIVNFLKSPFLSINSLDVVKYILYIDKYEPQNEMLLRNKDFNFDGYFDILMKYKSKENMEISVLLDVLKNVLDAINFSTKVEEIMKHYYTNNDIENYRMIKQSYEKSMKIFDEVGVLNDYKCDFGELKQFFDLFAENSSIVIPPVVNDAIFISNLDCENLTDIDYVYFLGFNEGAAPKYSVDSGILTDEEIERMPIKSRLNPTIKVINKRLKFKLFELLFVANKQIILSYPMKNGEVELYPNAFINSLKLIYGISELFNASTMIDLINNSFSDLDYNNFIYNNLSKSSAIDNFVYLLKFWDNYSDNENYVKLLSNLYQIVGDNTYIDNLLFENNIKSLNLNMFMSKNKIGLSEIERFNVCPYMHFVDYGLKLKPTEKTDLSKIDIGNIIHEFVKDIVFRLQEENIANEVLSKILEKEDYKYLTDNKKNNFIIKSLYDEVERIFKVLKYQQSLTKFQTYKTELPFNAKMCNIDDREIFITGIVDRVDKCENGIRIVDYKTGKISFKNFEDVYYGNKIQVILYLSVLSKKNGFEPKGALYLPISNAFSDNKSEQLYRMEGVIEKSLSNIINFDENISKVSYTSDIINISTTTKGEISNNNFYKTMCIDSVDMEKLCVFVEGNVIETIKNIDKNIIEPYPLDEDSCRYCEYRAMCNFSIRYKNKYRKDKTIVNLNDMFEEVEDE